MPLTVPISMTESCWELRPRCVPVSILVVGPDLPRSIGGRSAAIQP